MKFILAMFTIWLIVGCAQRQDISNYIIEVDGQVIKINNNIVKWENDTDVNNWIRSNRPKKVDLIANYKASGMVIFFIGIMFVEGNDIPIDGYARCPKCLHLINLERNSENFTCLQCGFQESAESFYSE